MRDRTAKPNRPAKAAQSKPKKAKRPTRHNGTIARPRYSGDLPQIGSGEQPYALCRPRLKGLTRADVTRLIVRSAAWREVMKPALAELDRERRRPGKEQAFYTCEELETVLLHQRVCRLTTYKRLRQRLAGDDNEARLVLGFSQPRMAYRRPRRTLKHFGGVPSEATISRYKKFVGRERRRDLWQRFEERLLEEHLATPELADEADILFGDGTLIPAHYTAPHFDPKTKKLVNEESVTAPDAGYRAKSAGPDKSGDGWSLVSIVTRAGVPLLPSRVIKINENERATAQEMIESDFHRLVLPRIGGDKLRVLSADMAFAGQPFRAALREVGIIENIHGASHANTQRSLKHAKEMRAFKYQIKGYPNWRANGHREINCVCGQCRTARRVFIRHGRTVARLEGTGFRSHVEINPHGDPERTYLQPVDSSQLRCEGCRFREQIIIELQHLVRDLRHELDNERVAQHQSWDATARDSAQDNEENRASGDSGRSE